MSNYDLGLFFAHGEGDCGAVGNGYAEENLSKQIVTKILNILKSKNLNVHTNIESGYNNYKRNLTQGNTYKYKMAFTLHLNSSDSTSANGIEILVPLNEKTFNLETKVLNEFKNLGFTNRGLKSRYLDNNEFVSRTNGVKLSGNDWYSEIRNAWSNGVSLSIFELCFISNKSDVERFVNNIDKISVIISNAILESCGLNIDTTSAAPTTSNVLYRVQVGAYSIKDNALKKQGYLKQYGFDSTLIYENNLYHVQVGAYSIKENAINMQNKLKNYNLESIIK